MSDFVLQEPHQEQPKEDGKTLILYQENICYLPHHFANKSQGVDNEPIKKYCYHLEG